MKHGKLTNVAAGRRHQSSGSDAVQSVNCCSTSTEIVRKIKRAVKIAGSYNIPNASACCVYMGEGGKWIPLVMCKNYIQYVWLVIYSPAVWFGVGQHRDPSLRRVRRDLGVAVPSVERSALAGTVDTALRSCPQIQYYLQKETRLPCLSYTHAHIVRCFVISIVFIQRECLFIFTSASAGWWSPRVENRIKISSIGREIQSNQPSSQFLRWVKQKRKKEKIVAR